MLRFLVVRTRRHGRELPDRGAAAPGPVEGELQCFMVDDPHLRRSVRIAKLTGPRMRAPELIPPLYDADVTPGSDRRGHHRDRTPVGDDGVVDFAQSWSIRLV